MNALALNSINLKHIFNGYYIVIHTESATFSCTVSREEIGAFFTKLHDEFGELSVNIFEEDLS